MVQLKGSKEDRDIEEAGSSRDDADLGARRFSPHEDPSGGDLRVDVVRSVEGVRELERDFDRLQRVSGNTLPFLQFEWQLRWVQRFLRDEAGIVDRPMFHVMRHRDRTCAAIVPLIVTERRLGRLTFRTVGFLGADPNITEIRHSLVEPGCEIAVADALHRSLNASSEWDYIQWTGQSDRFISAIGALRELRWQPMAPSYVLDLPATWDEFRAGLKRNIRESLRHCYNSLKRDGHSFELEVAADSTAVQAALAHLFVLHASRAAMPGTVPHPDHFESSEVRRFMLEVCGDLAARSIARVFQLKIVGQIVASRIGFVIGRSLYLYYSGYDPEWARYGVMTTTMAEAIKYAIARGITTINLSPGNDVSKTRWGPREVPCQMAYEHDGSLTSRLVSHAYVKARSGTGLQGWLLRRLMPGRRNWN